MACFEVEMVNDGVVYAQEGVSYLMKLTREGNVLDVNEVVVIGYSSGTLVNGVDYIGEIEATILKDQDSTYFNLLINATDNTNGGSLGIYPSSENSSYCFALVINIDPTDITPVSNNCCSVFADTYSQWEEANIIIGEGESEEQGTCNSLFGVYNEVEAT